MNADGRANGERRRQGKRGGSRGRGGADVEAGERGVSALAPDLDGFELVEGLEEEAVEVGLVARDLGDGVVAADKAAADVVMVPRVQLVLARLGVAESLAVLEADGEIVRDRTYVNVDHLALVSLEAIEAPEDGGDALGEDGLEVALGTEGVHRALAMGLPLRAVFQVGDEGAVGEDAMLEGVAADCGLARLGVGAAFGDGSPPGGLIAVDAS